MDEKTRVMIVKLLKAERVDSFLDGNVYMNSAAYFKELDSADVVRSDRHEGLHSARQVKEISVQDSNGQWIPIGGIINPVTYFTDESSNFNMFCMYIFNDNPDEPFNEKNLAFGESFVLILDIVEFLRRVRVAAQNLDRECAHAPVEYVDGSSYDGPMGPFRKFDSFSYQNEYRIVLRGGEGNPITLQIGNIRDIAVVGQTKELGELINKIKRGEKIYISSNNPQLKH